MSTADVLLWIRSHKSSVAGLLLVALGCVALVGLARKAHHLKPRPRPVAGVVAPSADSAASGGGGGLTPSAQQGTEQNTRTARMRTEFENAPNYLEFINQAIARPQEGGKFYAMLAWKRCNDLTQHKGAAPVHVGNDAFAEGAAALIEDIEKRCTGVLEAYPTAQALYDVAMNQRGGTDFLMPTDGRGIVTPTARQTADADLDAALKTADRWAVAEALQNNAAFIDVGNSAGDDGVDRQLHEWSAQIVACELVGNCRGGIEVSLHCVGTGDCAHDDFRDVIRGEVPDTHRMIFDTMVEGMRQRVGLTAQPTDSN